ncbi:hypothetical protein [Phytohabitans aurantiacus]|nr:hypothetical protein [Phytohabitans aurantiacus]
MTNELGYATGEAAGNRLNFPGVNTVEVNPTEAAQTIVVFLAPETFRPAKLVLTDNSEPIKIRRRGGRGLERYSERLIVHCGQGHGCHYR